ncbi:hypothetical protein DMH04_17330 [Kibdelosporangium aridum]|uniref:Uncharacterized protein n=1 Tax=Kibdelosporangium aridum TaxID=2030 RepID=A0A428ZBQ7_KIBAR|nr:hypothetical protein [Kibdelosporangium aridum]RSM85512.1 hypothetical protein DMH04_17330 [Kibdelosporangium aridum]
MKRISALLAILFTTAAPYAAAAQDAPISVTLDQDQIGTFVGRVHSVESQITNRSSAPSGTVIAHLNVASVDGTYVDLEDWSADVTKPVSLSPGESTTVAWDFQAVNAGSFTVYVVLVPDKGPLVASSAIRVDVAEQQTLDAGGALPVAIAIPLLLGLGTLGLRYRIRQKTQ